MVKAWKKAIQVGWDPNSENVDDNGRSADEAAPVPKLDGRDWNDIVDEDRAEEAASGDENDKLVAGNNVVVVGEVNAEVGEVNAEVGESHMCTSYLMKAVVGVAALNAIMFALFYFSSH